MKGRRLSKCREETRVGKSLTQLERPKDAGLGVRVALGKCRVTSLSKMLQKEAAQEGGLRGSPSKSL